MGLPHSANKPDALPRYYTVVVWAVVVEYYYIKHLVDESYTGWFHHTIFAQCT